MKVDKDLAFDRLCAMAKIDIAKLHKHPAWLNFPGELVSWASANCDLERDVWPTIERLLLTANSFPSSPRYFAKAVLEARDKRLTSANNSPTMWDSKWTQRSPVKLVPASLAKGWAAGLWGPWEICGRMPTDPLCDLPDALKADLLAIRSEPGKWVGDRREGYA